MKNYSKWQYIWNIFFVNLLNYDLRSNLTISVEICSTNLKHLCVTPDNNVRQETIQYITIYVYTRRYLLFYLVFNKLSPTNYTLWTQLELNWIHMFAHDWFNNLTNNTLRQVFINIVYGNVFVEMKSFNIWKYWSFNHKAHTKYAWTV